MKLTETKRLVILWERGNRILRRSDGIRFILGEPYGSYYNAHYNPLDRAITLESTHRSLDPRSTKHPLLYQILIAHELGHALSDGLGFRDSRLDTIDEDRPFTAEESRIRRREEVRAWFYARHLLRGLDFACWPKFREIRREALACYPRGDPAHPLRGAGRNRGVPAPGFAG